MQILSVHCSNKISSLFAHNAHTQLQICAPCFEHHNTLFCAALGNLTVSRWRHSSKWESLARSASRGQCEKRRPNRHCVVETMQIEHEKRFCIYVYLVIRIHSHVQLCDCDMRQCQYLFSVCVSTVVSCCDFPPINIRVSLREPLIECVIVT